MDQVELQIEYQGRYVKLDIDQNTTFQFNISNKDLKNPTITWNEFSVQLSIPRTRHNNQIFEEIWRLDGVVSDFNPLKRNGFRLYVNYDLFEEGYISLEELTNRDYKIRLYGGLGDYFYQMSETMLRDLPDDGFLSHEINRQQVYRSFTGGAVNNLNGIDISEFLSYVMTYQGQYPNFDADHVVSTLSGDEYEDLTWYDPRPAGNQTKTYASPTLTEHGRIDSNSTYGEYRSYYQKPALRFKYLYSQIIRHMQSHEWNTVLDPGFFNENNPYWNDLWVMFNNYTTESSNVTTSAAYHNRQTESLYSPTSLSKIELKQQLIYNPDGIDFNNAITLDVSVPIALKALVRTVTQTNIPRIRLYDSNGALYNIGVKCYAIDNNGNIYEVILNTGNNGVFPNVQFFIASAITSMNPNNFPGGPLQDFYMDFGGNSKIKNSPGITQDSIMTFAGSLTIPAGVMESFDLFLDISYYGPTGWSNYSIGSNIYNYSIMVEIQDNFKVDIIYSGSNAQRSGNIVTYPNIVQSDRSLYDFFASYNKIFDLHYIKDAGTKTVQIMTRNTFYASREVVDWTDKIDYSESRTIKPVPFDYRYGVLKWQDNDGAKYEDAYLAETNRSYGSLVFDTGYELNNDEKNYIEDNLFNNCVIATDYSQYYLGKTDTIYKDDKYLPHLQEKDGVSPVDIDMILLFRQPGTVNIRPVIVTDDSSVMTTDGYMYNRFGNGMLRWTPFTRVTNVNGQLYSLNFGRPQKGYNEAEAALIGTATEAGEETLYARFWRDYLRDIFDINAKVLTCYVNLTNNDVHNFLLNKFYNINNTLWRIDKIHNFNPTGHVTTRVDLIKVKDINNYVSQVYPDDGSVLEIIPENTHVDANLNSYNISVIASGDWTLEIPADYDTWLYARPIRGAGSGTVTVTVSPNTLTIPRTAFLSISLNDGSKSVIHNLNQDGKGPDTDQLNVIVNNNRTNNPGGTIGSILVNDMSGVRVKFWNGLFLPGMNTIPFTDIVAGTYTVIVQAQAGTITPTSRTVTITSAGEVVTATFTLTD